ncbi:MAG TPA: AAA family ATPase, partial [Pyrinomonadaceae bacterium]|nr:AAA family ATPase [Pyrinomonadaceae bacterium]
DIFNVLLQVFEDGILTDALGNTVDFKNAIIIMTSNIGARFIQKRGALGFQANAIDSREKLEDMVMSAVKQTFNPEFINRLDEIIIFDELQDDELLEIVTLQVELMNRMLRRRGLEVRLTAEAKSWIVKKTCADRTYGARPLRRALQKYVEDPLSEALIQGELGGATLVEIYEDGGALSHRPAGVEEVGDELLIH